LIGPPNEAIPWMWLEPGFRRILSVQRIGAGVKYRVIIDQNPKLPLYSDRGAATVVTKRCRFGANRGSPRHYSPLPFNQESVAGSRTHWPPISAGAAVGGGAGASFLEHPGGPRLGRRCAGSRTAVFARRGEAVTPLRKLRGHLSSVAARRGGLCAVFVVLPRRWVVAVGVGRGWWSRGRRRRASALISSNGQELHFPTLEQEPAGKLQLSRSNRREAQHLPLSSFQLPSARVFEKEIHTLRVCHHRELLIIPERGRNRGAG